MKNTIYALGFFDGVHIGHAALLSACKDLAKVHGCSTGVVTFAAHPDTLVRGNTPPAHQFSPGPGMAAAGEVRYGNSGDPAL